ncbi:hypothetical protein M8V02_19035, partial [Enterobacter hormaechei]|nr:hypothetical protein [Enterobacter hormaechei]MCM8505418.1 hypothetical protein [Enterobacter hormaechei]MDF3700336.1 hypothetical protein [Enterobacter hormaechei]MDF3715521.1 hypothetical protein [Enterobacter hormaechei]
MSFNKLGLATVVAMVLSAGSAMAAPSDTGTITFHGMVSNNTCKVLMNPLMILVKIIKLRWIHILSYDQM